MWTSVDKGCDGALEREQAPPPRRERGLNCSGATSGGAAVDSDRERHRLVQRCGRGVLADRLDRLVELQRPAVELDAGLVLDGGDDVGGRDGAEQLALGTRLGLDR